MRIGIFTDTYYPYINGVSTSIDALSKSLTKKGHQVYIVTVNPDNMSYKFEDDEHIIRIPGIPVGIYDYRLTGIYPIRAINKIKRWNLDIIHSHTEFGVGTFARIIAKQLDIPLVHTYHTMYEDYVHYITKGYFDKSSKKIVEYLTKFYCDKTAKELIVPSNKTYKLFKEKYHVDKNVHIIPTGIEVERFDVDKINKKDILTLKAELGIKKDDFVILYVGRLAQEKNVELLIEAHAKLAKKIKNIKLVIVGSGPDYQKYTELSKSLKISSKVIFTNAIPWQEIPIYYALADVFVTASTTETQGLTVIEAMAASLPVVCIDDPSFNIIVKDKINGRIFKNQEEYEECIKELVNNKSLIKNMKKEAKIAASEYSLDHFGDRVLEIYKLALKDKDSSIWSKMTKAVKRGLNAK